MSGYRNQLEDYLKTLDIKADRVLDVGGAANPVNRRVRSWDVKEYLIADNGLEDARVDFKLLDLNDKQQDARGKESSSFDLIFCLEVMEYIYNPAQAIKNISNIIKIGGLFYVTFPFIYSIHEPKQADYLRYTKQGAIKLLENNGFKILEIIPRIMTPLGEASWNLFVSQEGMHTAKGVNHNELGCIIKAQKCI